MVKFKQNRAPIFTPYDGWHDADHVFEKVMYRKYWATEDRNKLATLIEKVVAKEVKRALAHDVKQKAFEEVQDIRKAENV